MYIIEIRKIGLEERKGVLLLETRRCHGIGSLDIRVHELAFELQHVGAQFVRESQDRLALAAVIDSEEVDLEEGIRSASLAQ